MSPERFVKGESERTLKAVKLTTTKLLFLPVDLVICDSPNPGLLLFTPTFVLAGAVSLLTR
jgi:hypothetical protein